MDEDQATLPTARDSQDADSRLVARLKQLVRTPGISVKDRQLIDRNLQRLVEALDRRKAEGRDSA
ncbi:MAG TPA: hypothetical protein VFW44_06855 [Bryobacteraceae bacterium]|nr:hypothetical protein [Bryobacteraceae bacterium]